MKNREKLGTVFSIILLFNMILCSAIEFYFVVLKHGEGFIYKNMSNFDKTIYIILYVLIFVMILMFIMILVLMPKSYSCYDNYVLVHKDSYKSMQKELLNHELKNMNQDLKIKELNTKLLVSKLNFKIWEKIFKHNK